MMRLALFVLAAATWASPTMAYPPAAYSPSPLTDYRYQYVVYHREVARLDAEILLRKAEIASLERMLKEWEPLDRFSTGRPVMIDIERTRLQILEAQLSLKCLEQVQFDLTHSRGRW